MLMAMLCIAINNKEDDSMIHVLMIYEKVNLVMPLEQRRFYNHLNDTLTELKAKYMYPRPELLFCGVEEDNEEENNRCDGCFPKFVISLEEYIPIHNLYAAAIADNVLYLAGAGEGYKAEFERKAEEAYNSYWKRNASSGRRIKRGGW